MDAFPWSLCATVSPYVYLGPCRYDYGRLYFASPRTTMRSVSEHFFALGQQIHEHKKTAVPFGTAA